MLYKGLWTNKFTKSQAFRADNVDTTGLDADALNQVSKIQLTRTEFADALGLKPTSMFVRNMYLMVDKDRNGFVSFKEFMEMFTILAKGIVLISRQLNFQYFNIFFAHFYQIDTNL